MNLFKNIENIYFSGIGGIGMSALARYFLAGGYNVAGYDKTSTKLTTLLLSEGCVISFDDRISSIPPPYRDSEKTVVIYTPAIHAGNIILNHFRGAGYRIYKRSAILGFISEQSNTVAIAGTHGKTTVSTLTAHLLKQSAIDCTAFMGGISKNYNTNLLLGGGDITVMEADEYDRSFHTLKPAQALITSMDPDHLEVYGNYANMIDAYNKFASRIRSGGKIVVNSKIRNLVKDVEGVEIYTYGTSDESDFWLVDATVKDGACHFSVNTPFGLVDELVWTIPGKLNLQNAVAAISLAMFSGVTPVEIRKSILLFRGVVRRFDIRVSTDEIIYIDDYAHHPVELDFLINSIRQFYGNRIITAAFQPHLFTRTRDHFESFARSLDHLDRVFILPIYPAREEPIEGVGSELIYDNMMLDNKMMVSGEELLEQMTDLETDIFMTIGAGDIDRLVDPLTRIFQERGR